MAPIGQKQRNVLLNGKKKAGNRLKPEESHPCMGTLILKFYPYMESRFLQKVAHIN